MLPGDFLQDIWKNTFTIIYAGMMFPVRHKRVKPWEDKIVRMNGLTGYGWDDYVVTTGIQWGQQLVFTKSAKLYIIGSSNRWLRWSWSQQRRYTNNVPQKATQTNT